MSARNDDEPGLRIAAATDIDIVEPLVRAYHEFERIESDAASRRYALSILVNNPELGRLWLIEVSGDVVGYIALCFGYTLEFAGRDAFIDEFFIRETHRGRGIGGRVLERVATAARDIGVRALHLEVARDNVAAARLYGAAGFVGRDRFHLMTRVLLP